MFRYRAGCRVAGALALAAFAVCASAMVVGAQTDEALAALNKQAVTLFQQGKYVEATEVAKRLLEAGEKKYGRDALNTGTWLNNLAELYRVQGRYDEAEPLYLRALRIAEKQHGPDHDDVGLAISNLAGLYQLQGRYAEAEPAYKRALTIREKALGSDHVDVAETVNNLALLYQQQGRLAEAEALDKRALSIYEKSPSADPAQFSATLSNLANIYQQQGLYTQAEPLYKRSLSMREKALGADHPDIGEVLHNLAGLYQDLGRYDEAESLLERAVALSEKAFGPDSPDLAITLGNLAGVYRDQGRYAEAEPLLKRSLAIRERALGLNHPSVGLALNNLASLYREQGRAAEAETLYKRGIAIGETSLGPDHLEFATMLGNLAGLYEELGRYTEAEPLHARALSIREKALGADHPDVGFSLNNLAGSHFRQGHFAEAEKLYKRALAIFEKALGPGHAHVATALSNLASVYEAQGRTAEAQELAMSSLHIREKALGPDHPDVGLALHNIAAQFFRQGDWRKAADYWRRSTTIVIRRGRRDASKLTGTSAGSGESEAAGASEQFEGLVKATYRLRPDEAAAREMFESAQWAQNSQTAASIAQMAARGAKGDPALARMVRERQDLVSEWGKLDALRIAVVSLAPEKRNRQAEEGVAARLDEIDRRLGEIDRKLQAAFPDYAALSRSEPLSVEQVRAVLAPNEALVLFLDTPEALSTPEETFIWVVTKTDLRWVRSDLGRAALKREVQALRCGLDRTAWSGTRCSEVTGGRIDSGEGGSLPFDHARAHALYKALLGQTEDLTQGKQLLLVPSGALTQLPFQVLISAPATGNDDRKAAWLMRDHALTVLPAVSSLQALRRVARPSAATRPLIGFGNPLLDGGEGSAREAQQARDRQSCGNPVPASLQISARALAGAAPAAAKGQLADVTEIRRLMPLPETVDELCAVARDVHADLDEIRLGKRSTEAEVKALSKTGRLAQYRIVHFATHGALAGELQTGSEPGLILTPPAKASEEDDGYLSSSEIAGLKLDADLVILSACNTAAGEAANAEALSGLARAFIYAQTRALLVSHWAVDSNATVKLITATIAEMAGKERTGPAEALRRAMLALIATGQPYEAHPASWAPFIVVGEGSR